jgi:hypothetical protein
MSSFFNQLSQISTDGDASAPHNNVHATPNPVEMAAAAGLLREQLEAIHADSDNPRHQNFLESLMSIVQGTIEDPPSKVQGVPQSYLDGLERVDKRKLKKTDSCPICNEAFLDDEYPLVVQLPCHATHRFDMDCVGPWLRMNGTCPLDRKELMKKKEVPKPTEDEEEDYDDMYA